MHNNDALPTNEVAASSVHAIRDRHLRILIVDDEYGFREALSSNLSEKYEAVVTDVGSGCDAVQRLKAGEAFDVIFLDLIMPDMSGTETYAELKKIDANCSIVMMSSRSDSPEWMKAETLAGQLCPKPGMVRMLGEILGRV